MNNDKYTSYALNRTDSKTQQVALTNALNNEIIKKCPSTLDIL